MSSYQKQQRVLRRGVFLHHLLGVNNLPTNADILLMVAKGCGIPTFYNEAVADLHWLEEKGFVKTSGDNEVVIAELTRRGLRLARNEATDPGVRLPDPGA
ncbi:hypothetical protein [Leisingera sp. NJS204]|uniref:hypothetical protein n=1 Tax=Leisingera sp. NJS204 TaxID=2508307 RepID=UPI0010107FD9|nr:hypothetical protein [Leisingera sp. NJS204]QAX29281.1 hypothetical protein ETW24_07895 [Leisingera sp. NJS204]